VLLTLRGNPGRPSLASMQEELAKLELIRGIDLPIDVFDQTSARDLERCRRRVAVEAPYELRRQPNGLPLIFLTPRLGEMMISEVSDGKAQFYAGVQG
jgi:hypothetical protein